MAPMPQDLYDGLWTIVYIIVGVPLAIAFLVWLFLFLPHQISRSKRIAAAPFEGPMQVNITENHEPYGRFACELIVDVKLSQKDWATLRRSGLGQRVMMTAPARTGAYDDTQDLYASNLSIVTSFHFFDTEQMQAAKAHLISQLHGLKAAIEAYQEGPKTESFEI